MEVATLQGQARQAGGRHANERLRRGGMIPAVIYGHGEPAETVAVSMHDLLAALARQQHVVRLSIGGKDQQYLIKDVQYDHLQKNPLHVDLMRVDVRERVKVRVPLELRGTPAGAAEGGVLAQQLVALDVECELQSIPEVLRANVAPLGLNQTLKVRDVELPEGVAVQHDLDEIVAVVKAPRGTEVVEAAPPAEGAAEPEVIGKGPKESEDESGE